MSITEEQQVRSLLAAAVGREVLPQPVWEVLVGVGHVSKFLAGEMREEQLSEYARALLLYGDVVEQTEARPEPKEGKPVPSPPRFVYKEERAMTLASCLALMVNTHSDVLTFRRKRFVGGRPLSCEDAYLLSETPDLRVTQSGSQEADETTQSGTLELFSRGPEERKHVEFEAGSVLAELHKVSQKLRKELFPPWSEAEAAWTVATGKVRRTPHPIVTELTNNTNDHLTYGTINLTVEPWVATEAVVKAYQWAQARMLGRKPRALIERNLRVVQFVMGELGELISREMDDEAVPPRLSWRKLMDRWNEANPEDAYTDERHFHRDFYRTANAVVRPYDASHLIDQSPDSPPET